MGGLSLGLSLGLSRRAGGSAFNPASLFAASEAGAWYDPSDLSTLWQDTGGTVAVTSDGDSVARIDDKSGNGNHLTQATAGLRSVYKTDGTLRWLQYDGVDDVLESAAIDMTITSQLALFDGVRILTPISNNSPVTMFGGDTINGSLWWFSGAGSLDNVQAGIRGTATALSTKVSETSPVSRVTTILGDLAAVQADQIDHRRDGVNLTASVSADAAGTVFGNNTIVLGKNTRTGSTLFGNIYQSVVLSRTPTAQEITDTEAYIANKSGVSL